jgi:hypothetical protein
MLETFVLDPAKDVAEGAGAYGSNFLEAAEAKGMPYFQDSDVARFIRLVVVEDDLTLRDSSKGYTDPNNSAQSIYKCAPAGMTPPANIADCGTMGGIPQYDEDYTHWRLLTHTNVPIDLQEWYFIVATYDPDINETTSYSNTVNNHLQDFWNWNINSDETYTSKSGLGNKCKVEIISKTDLLRARGYRL